MCPSYPSCPAAEGQTAYPVHGSTELHRVPVDRRMPWWPGQRSDIHEAPPFVGDPVVMVLVGLLESCRLSLALPERLRQKLPRRDELVKKPTRLLPCGLRVFVAAKLRRAVTNGRA